MVEVSLDPLNHLDFFDEVLTFLKSIGYKTQPPALLYHYRPIIHRDDDQEKKRDPVKRLMDEIGKGRIHLTRTIEFDDPYDSLLSVPGMLDALDIKLGMDEEPPEWFTLICEQMHNLISVLDKYRGKKINPNTVEHIMNQLLDYEEDDNCLYDREDLTFEDLFDQLSKDMRTLTVASCFSENGSSLVMWDRYASGHTGICIEYDAAVLSSNNGNPFNIQYSENLFTKYPKQMDFLETIFCGIIGSILTKNEDYRIEKEWRSFSANVSKKYLNGSGAVKCVYLGSRIKESDAKRLIRYCKRKQIPIKRVITDNVRYHLDMVNVD